MPQQRDWYPNKRQDQLDLVQNWLKVFNETVKNDQGEDVKKRVVWGISPETVIALGHAFAEAQEALQATKSEETRTAVATTRCNVAFPAMEKLARDIKRRYFFVPPLLETDITALGLQQKDDTKTPVPIPPGQATAEVSYPGTHQHTLRFTHISGTPIDERSQYGYRYYWGILPPGGAEKEYMSGLHSYLTKEPASGSELHSSKFTRRRIETVPEFSAEDSGKRVYYCVRYENTKGESGPWGPMFSAIIP